VGIIFSAIGSSANEGIFLSLFPEEDEANRCELSAVPPVDFVFEKGEIVSILFGPPWDLGSPILVTDF